MKKTALVIGGLLFSFVLLGSAVYLVAETTPITGTAQFSVAKMTCGACAGKINAALAQIPGVGRVQVDVARGTATVAFAEDRVSVYRLAKAISSAGYPAQVSQIWLAADGPAPVPAPQGNAAGRSGGCGGGCCGGS